MLWSYKGKGLEKWSVDLDISLSTFLSGCENNDNFMFSNVSDSLSVSTECLHTLEKCFEGKFMYMYKCMYLNEIRILRGMTQVK